MNGRPTRRQAEAPVQKKSPRVAPRGKVGWWRKSTYTTIDTWYREKLHLFGKKMQEIVAAVFTAFLEFSCGSLRRVEVVLFSGFHDIASTLNVCLSEIHSVLSLLRLKE